MSCCSYSFKLKQKNLKFKEILFWNFRFLFNNQHINAMNDGIRRDDEQRHEKTVWAVVAITIMTTSTFHENCKNLERNLDGTNCFSRKNFRKMSEKSNQRLISILVKTCNSMIIGWSVVDFSRIDLGKCSLSIWAITKFSHLFDDSSFIYESDTLVPIVS